MTDEHPPSLAADADPNSWYFKNPDQDGPLPNPVGHTFPLLTHDPNGRWELIGTGFYASSDGLFITARHNIRHVLQGDGRFPRWSFCICDRPPDYLGHPRCFTALSCNAG
jgi:hypothetical protein